MEHYFCVRRDGKYLVAAIQPTEPKEDDKGFGPQAIIIGKVLAACVQNPADLNKWCDMMNTLSDNRVREFMESTGNKVVDHRTETIVDNIPKVN